MAAILFDTMETGIGQKNCEYISRMVRPILQHEQT